MTVTGTVRILAVVLIAGSATTPAAAADTREACRADAIHYCRNEVAARDRKAVRRCIRDNLDKVSATCRDAIAEQRAEADAKTRPPADGEAPAAR